MRNRPYLFLLFCALAVFYSCSKSDVSPTPQDNDIIGNNNSGNASFNINSIKDTYQDISSFQYHAKWSVYNVHDPSIKKFGEYYYCYSTDVAYGFSIRPGIQIRRSKDLVEWHFMGWVFPDIPIQGANYIKGQGGTPNSGIWAPYIMKINGTYRLYYSLSSPTPRLSVIGLATASSPLGPWKESGIVVTSTDNNTVQTNAIDPSVIVTPSGEKWMYYGSAWDGIYILKLNPSTGLAANPGDKGMRIAQRGFTNGQINGNIEGPEIIYNKKLRKYFLFISYDWLETKYNVRVGRSDNPQGPFYDFNGIDLNTEQDNSPMILAPYQFKGHGGWQGTGHCSVFTNDDGQYFMAHQARPSVNKYFMDLHVRKMFWTKDGWPVVSPERYAWEDNSIVPKDSLFGNWEQIILGYRIVPGYQAEQVSPDLQVSTPLVINADGSLNNDAGSTWSYDAPWLTMNWSNGYTDKVFVQKGRDWENKKETIIFSGLNNKGTAIWGKKIIN